MARDGKLKGKAGMPLMFATPEILQERIDNYFKSISKIVPLLDDEGNVEVNGLGEEVKETVYFEQPTVTGLAMYLGTNRQTLCNYEKDDNFYPVVKGGKQRIEKSYEDRLISRGKVADIFAMKNFGWNGDKVTVEQTNHNIDVTPTIVNDTRE